MAKELLGDYWKEYSDICFQSKTNISEIYEAINKKDDRQCCLKIIKKKELQKADYDFHLERLKREEEIMELCNSDNIVKCYRKLENDNSIIYELEYCEQDLQQYLSENGELKREKDFFKQIVLDLAKALMILQKNGIIHRDIKPANIFISDINGERKIKLGDFGCAIHKKDNKSDSIGTYFYNAPEVIQNLEYDEKCDFWSLGITLFELYFGILPYAPMASTNIILKYIYGDKEWIFKKTKDPDLEEKDGEISKTNIPKDKDIIPNLDVLFRRLLTIDPKKRMSYNEFFDYVSNKDFMNPEVIAINNTEEYKKIYSIAENEPAQLYYNGITQESNDDVKIEQNNVDKIINIVGEGLLPDIMNFANGSISGEEKYNNIIYYDENIKNHKKYVYQDSDYFERITPGAFILCTNLDSLNLIRQEILSQIKRDKNIVFNLITTGSQCEKVMNFIKKDKEFENCIKHVCVYCFNLEKWSKLKEQYDKIYEVFNETQKVKDFINTFSSKEIKPFYVTKLITLEDYLDKYNDRHFTISQFYGNLDPNNFNIYLEEIKKIIEEKGEKKELFNPDKNKLLEGFLSFDLSKDLKKLDELVIHEYTKNTFYGDLNKWLMNSKMNFYQPVAYFTARLMYHLNSFAQKKNYYFKNNQQEVHRGAKLNYSSLLPYERAEGKVILLSAFTSTSEDKNFAERWAGRKDPATLYKTKLKFSVVFIINNICNNNWISNGINVQKISKYKNEKEILYQPFSFYKVRRVEIDHTNFIANIYLETIGKMQILEEQIKMNKKLKYNEKKKIMEVEE